jgi:hypothetical protein
MESINQQINIAGIKGWVFENDTISIVLQKTNYTQSMMNLSMLLLHAGWRVCNIEHAKDGQTVTLSCSKSRKA